MSSLAALEQLLYHVSSALYGPVVVACAFLELYVPIQVGITLQEGWQRRQRRYVARARFAALLRHEVEVATPGTLTIRAERLLQQEELELTRRLDRVRSVIRIGPALGLMGTLIPMGISLAALAEGNIPKMAESMVTAFTATVAGLGAGVVSYLLSLVRERWVREDVREMACEAELAIAVRSGAQRLHLQEEADDAVAVPA
jgi:biopolymer transport protein ExbB/TolQ